MSYFCFRRLVCSILPIVGLGQKALVRRLIFYTFESIFEGDFLVPQVAIATPNSNTTAPAITVGAGTSRNSK